MNISRPESFNSIVGHSELIANVTKLINKNSFPQFTLIYGEEGLGKTTLVKLIAMALSCTSESKPCGQCDSCVNITQKVIRENRDTESVKTFKMSVEGSKDAVKEVLANLNTAFLQDGIPKVVILEECHGMPESAQDALLSDIEYLEKNVYVIMVTTNMSKLTKTLLSRPVTYSLHRLSNKEMVRLLTREANRRNLTIQGGNITLELIASWAENKPRKALKVLEAMGSESNVTMDMIKSHINFLDISNVLPILSSLGETGSIVIGLHHVYELQVSREMHNHLIQFLTEVVKIAYGERSVKLTNEDYTKVRRSIDTVPKEKLVEFLYDIARVAELTQGYLIASYLKQHRQGDLVDKGERNDILTEERNFKRSNNTEYTAPSPSSEKIKPPWRSLD